MPNVHWENTAKTRLVVAGSAIHLNKMKQGVQEMNQDLHDFLFTHLLHSLPRANFPISRPGSSIFEDLQDETVGYNFIEDERNVFGEHRWAWMKGMMGSETLLGGHYSAKWLVKLIQCCRALLCGLEWARPCLES